MCFRLSRRPSAKRVTTSLWSSNSCRTSWQYWASSAWSLICRPQNHELGWSSPDFSAPHPALAQPSPEGSLSASGRHGCTARAARKRCGNSQGCSGHQVENSHPCPPMGIAIHPNSFGSNPIMAFQASVKAWVPVFCGPETFWQVSLYHSDSVSPFAPWAVGTLI